MESDKMTDNIIKLPHADKVSPALPQTLFVREDYASYEEFHAAVMAAADALNGHNIIPMNG
jgi:hypothetical protein